MDEAGIDRAALVQFTTVYGYDNSYLVDAVAGDRERFAGVCSVDPFWQDSPNELESLVKEQGMAGLRLFTPAGWVEAPEWPDEPTVRPIVERAMRLQLPIAVQLRPAQIGRLRSLALRFPAATFLVDHLAGVGATADATIEEKLELFSLAELPNVSLKFSTMNLRPPSGPATAAELLRVCVLQFGAQRLLWGSNYPVSQGQAQPYAGLLEEAREALASTVSNVQRELILGDNAARLYGTGLRPGVS
jgi:predicted TIM-barrel fold metal-dependent hydrolase